ncbi:CHASE domain-containing protein [Massilia sp. B-10]|nr:CHASE domain-containing protein [Massilia sp. B-10]
MIGHGLDDAVEVLQVANQLFATVQPVSRRQFHDFTAPLLARHRFIQAFNYHRLISHAERPAAEAALSAEVPGTVITEMAPGGRAPRPCASATTSSTSSEPMA